MSSYYAVNDFDSYTTRKEAQANEAAAAEDAHQAAQAAYESAHQEWEDGGEIGEEPQPPTRVDPSPPPEPPSTTYERRDVTEIEQIDTETGPALVVPPRVVVTSSDGRSYAMSDAEFAAGYVEAAT